MDRMRVFLGVVVVVCGCLAIVIIILLIGYYTEEGSEPSVAISEVGSEVTAAPTDQLEQTGTMPPTESPAPTETVLPSATPEPSPTATLTPIPKETSKPSDTPIPTQTQISTRAPATSGNVVIINIYYNGIGRREPDEYVEIRNDDSQAIQLKDWSLRDEADHVFIFPNFVISPDQVCRIYTDEYHEESCGFNYAFTSSAIWNNSGDCATLRDSQGEMIDEFCY